MNRVSITLALLLVAPLAHAQDTSPQHDTVMRLEAAERAVRAEDARNHVQRDDGVTYALATVRESCSRIPAEPEACADAQQALSAVQRSEGVRAQWQARQQQAQQQRDADVAARKLASQRRAVALAHIAISYKICLARWDLDEMQEALKDNREAAKTAGVIDRDTKAYMVELGLAINRDKSAIAEWTKRLKTGYHATPIACERVQANVMCDSPGCKAMLDELGQVLAYGGDEVLDGSVEPPPDAPPTLYVWPDGKLHAGEPSADAGGRGGGSSTTRRRQPPVR